MAALRLAEKLSCSGYVIEYHGKPISTVKKGFRAAVSDAGLPKWVTPHILRHSGATWMVENGIPIAQVARMLGDSEKVTERVYGHHSPSYLAEAASALQLSVSGPVSALHL